MRAFLSHSSKDKNIVEPVWERLGKEYSWIDKVEIELGDVLLEKISKGINESTDFILFWSQHSSKAPWVRYELNMAVIKSLEEDGFKIKVIKLDNTELPLYLKPFLFYDASGNMSELPQNIANLLKMNEEVKVSRNTFINRSKELGLIELANDDDDIRIITLCGINGIGKRALIRRANEYLFQGGEIVGIQIKPGFDLVALALELSYKANEDIPSAFKEQSIEEYIEILIEKLHSKGKIIALYDVQHWLTEEGYLGNELKFIFDFSMKLEVLKYRPIFLTTTRFLKIPIEHEQIHNPIQIGAISSEHLITIINNWLYSQWGKREEVSKIRPIAEMLYGYPFAAKLAASLIAKYSVDYLVEYPIEIVQLRVDIAKYLIGEIKLDENVNKLLEAISIIDGPLPLEDIANALEYSAEDMRQYVENAAAANVVFYEEGILRVHPLVQDYYYRSSANSKHYKELVCKLAEHAKERLENLQAGTPLHSKLLPCVFRLVALSGDFQEAINLRSDLLGYLGQVVKDLYDSREYQLAYDYAKLILEDDKHNWNVRLYYGRCLIRLDNTEEAENELLLMHKMKERDVPVLHSLGRVHMARDSWEEALKWFSKALVIRQKHLPSLRDSAECYFQLKELDEAEGYIKRAKEIDSTNAYILQVESKVYEGRGRYDKAYNIMNIALLQNRNNPTFNHRMGRISELMQEYDKAKEHYSRAIENDTKSYESRLSLVSLKIDLGEYDEIGDEIEDLEKIITGRKQEVLRNVKAKYLLNAENDYDGASFWVDKNIRLKRDPMSYHIRATIEVRRGQDSFKQGYKGVGRQYYANALEFIKQGLTVFKNNKMLLELKEEIQESLLKNAV